MFDWLTSLSRFSMLINYTMWSSNFFCCIQLFPAFFIVQDFHSPDFSGSRFFRVQDFQVPGFSGSRVWVQVLEVARFSDICTIIELKELNCLCKHTKNVRSSQSCISMNFYTELSKEKVLPCEHG